MIKKEARKWVPRTSSHWLVAVMTVAMFAIGILTTINTVFFFSSDSSIIPYYMRDEFVTIYDYSPRNIIIDSGETFSVSYLYTKEENCQGSVSYYMRQYLDSEETESGDVLQARTFGPYSSAWPTALSHRWITQTFPDSYANLSSGNYEVFWQAIGTCDDRNVYTRGPTTNLIIR